MCLVLQNFLKISQNSLHILGRYPSVCGHHLLNDLSVNIGIISGFVFLSLIITMLCGMGKVRLNLCAHVWHFFRILGLGF